MNQRFHEITEHWGEGDAEPPEEAPTEGEAGWWTPLQMNSVYCRRLEMPNGDVDLVCTRILWRWEPANG